MSTVRQVLIVDLDGTLILDNSFHAFLRSAWKFGGMTMRRAMLREAARRTAGRSNRVEMKRRLLLAFSELSEPLRRRIVGATVEMIMPTISAPITKLIADWKMTSEPVVLATAAPQVYASVLAERLGISECIGTHLPVGAQYCELIGEDKRHALEEWLISKRLERSETRLVVASDSVDDLPLMRSADEVFIQSSDAVRREIERQLPAHVSRTHLDTETPQPGGGLWLWFDDKALGPLSSYEVHIALSKHRYCLLYEGASRWSRILPGGSLARAVSRVDCPSPPPTAQRVLLLIKRRVVRDKLGIFH